MDRHSHRIESPTSRDRSPTPLPITNDSNNDHTTNNSDKDDNDDDDDDDDSERFPGFDLEKVMDRFGDNVELLELILSSKLEEDRRRTQEAKLKSKQLDYLLQIKREDQQQQQLQRPQSSSSASVSALTQVYSPQPNRETHSYPANNDFTPFGPSFSSHSLAYETSYPPNHRNHHQERNYTPETSSDPKKAHQHERSIQTPLAPGIIKPIVSLSTPLPSIDSLDRVAHSSSSFFPPSPHRPPPPPFTYTSPETLPPFLHHQHRRSNSSPSTQSHDFISPPPPQKLPLPPQGTLSPSNAPQPCKRRRREMQSITMIIETKEYPYNDSYHWKNNGNTVHKKSGQRSIYYKCANKGCHVNKTVTFKGHGEYLIKYRGKHLGDCTSSSSSSSL